MKLSVRALERRVRRAGLRSDSGFNKWRSTPKASRWLGNWEGVPLPSRLEGLGECRKLHSGDRGGAPAENEFDKI